MARAHGSYPWRQGFKSLSRYLQGPEINVHLFQGFFAYYGWSARLTMAEAGRTLERGDL